jgi:hypothetical protein
VSLDEILYRDRPRNFYLAGKAVDRIERDAPSPHTGEADGSRLLLHFTDGTALEIVGGGGDCDGWINDALLSSDDLAARRRKSEEYAADQRAKAREREEWMALTCEERAARRVPEPEFEGLYGNLLYESMLALWPGERTIKLRCPECGETACPNAPTKTVNKGRTRVGL